MNWNFVLIGSLIMDSAIALFAILSGLELHYRRISDRKVDDFRQEYTSKTPEEWDTYLYKFKTLLSMDEFKEQIKQWIDPKLEDTIKKVSPFTPNKIRLIAYMFSLGIIIQIFGILI